MAKVKVSGGATPSQDSFRPALTREGRESQLISLAEDVAEQQMRNGTASSQIITHYLRLATEKERLERVKLENETELLIAKRKAVESGERSEELYERAIKAMRKYSGLGDSDEDY
jgi:hypothetical protein